MNKTIWKYELETKDKVKIEMPIGAEILTLQTQNGSGKPCLWVLVDEKQSLETREFHIFGTGHIIYDSETNKQRRYIGTYQSQSGNLVFHCFELLTLS